MSQHVAHQQNRRKMLFVATLMNSLVLVFWINDAYSIWQVLNNVQICSDVNCQKAMSGIFWTAIIQIIVYILVSSLAVWVIIRNFNFRLQQLISQTEAQKEVQDLYDNAPCGYHSLDANGIFIHINQTELNWLGYTREEVILKDFKDNLQGNGVKNLEMNLRRKDGSLLPVLINGSMIRDENGIFKHTRTTLTDFSAQRKLLDELEAARTIAEKSVETKERFMANMSHEIRTPMNALIGFTNLLERTPLDTKQEEFVKTIKKAGENLMTLINDLLDFSKIEAGMLRIEATPFDFIGLIHTIEMLFKPKADEKRVAFDTKIAQRIPQNLIGDPTRVSQIVVNLLSNAFKFTERGYVALTAELFDDNTDFATIKITVKDTGIGINNEELPRIFERFQQAKDDTTRLYGGSGLGLSIVKNLTEAMGGFVEADSKVDFGSTFSVILPFKKGTSKFQILDAKFQHKTPTQMSNTQIETDMLKSSITELQSGDLQTLNSKLQTDTTLQTLNSKLQTDTTLQTSNSKLQTDTPLQTSNFKLQTKTLQTKTLQTPRILVVEDNPMNQRLAALLLSDWGYEYEIVEDGQQAIEKVQTIDFQLILMDIQLPIMDGYTATAIIRNELKSNIPIIATTAHAFANEREKCLAAGMNEYVPKPLQEEEVLKVIRKYVISDK
jgi:signal transduction histidine kinase/ActR/RegA family two-component response regulator